VGTLIQSLTAEAARAAIPDLSALLEDTVESGASIGFLPPLAPGEAADYWADVAAAVAEGSRVLLVAGDAEAGLIGSAQLALETRPNGRHRAEVMKVMVHRKARRRGIGRDLMRAAEAEARRRGRTTLFLDTRRGDPAERLYLATGWTFAGSIPRYARSADGALDANAIYYKLLTP
jgi:ribosomal protein S18 acetylase RimI-like enzyme